jgi:hypothetical protein
MAVELEDDDAVPFDRADVDVSRDTVPEHRAPRRPGMRWTPRGPANGELPRGEIRRRGSTAAVDVIASGEIDAR